jgi:hypothetical protein
LSFTFSSAQGNVVTLEMSRAAKYRGQKEMYGSVYKRI